jgi:chromosome segregation ATPase
MVDLKECLRDAVGARSGVLESAIDAEEAVIAKFADAAKLKPRVDELTAEKAGLEGRIATLTSELAAERERCAALEANGAQRETDFEAQMAENDRLAAELADRDAQIAGLNGRLEEERAGAASLADDLEEARASGEQGVAARENEIGQLRDALARLEADANAKLGECQDEMDRLERSLEEARGDLEVSERGGEAGVAGPVERGRRERQLDSRIRLRVLCNSPHAPLHAPSTDRSPRRRLSTAS